MNILIIGNGGREHAMIKSLQKDERITTIHCSPGIDALVDELTNTGIAVSDFTALIDYAKSNDIDYTLVGPEAPLVDGLADAFKAEDLAVFGPGKTAAQLEASKAFSKHIMKKYKIPTADYEEFDNYQAALDYIKDIDSFPIVIKASGLAGGKGVVIPASKSEAEQELEEMMVDKKFGNAADKIIIESFLEGDEASVFAICDGENYVLLSPAQDHKRIGEGDTGKNTGGMGAYAPAPVVNQNVINRVKQEIVEPLLAGMSQEDAPYKGVLFCGLMIKNDQPSVVEFNCRFGDPETQVVLPLLKTPLIDLVKASIDGTMDTVDVELHETQKAMTVVVASGGYPDSYAKGYDINGLDQLNNIDVCLAGTKMADGQLQSNGGRVLNLVAIANSFQACADAIYSQIETVDMKDKYYRRDIAHKVLNS